MLKLTITQDQNLDEVSRFFQVPGLRFTIYRKTERTSHYKSSFTEFFSFVKVVGVYHSTFVWKQLVETNQLSYNDLNLVAYVESCSKFLIVFFVESIQDLSAVWPSLLLTGTLQVIAGSVR